MNTENEFQLTLPSNASITFSPDNKPANYTTTLPSPISLEGEWEVALIDVQYPHNWMNITKDVYVIFLIDTTNKDKVFLALITEQYRHYRMKYDKQLREEYKILAEKQKGEGSEILPLVARIPKGYYANEDISASWYDKELQPIKKNLYLVEKVLRKRKVAGGEQELFVKWKGWPNKFNSWIKDTDIQDNQKTK